jgi:hypothetical protein
MNKKTISNLENKLLPKREIEVPLFGAIYQNKLRIVLPKEIIDILRAEGLTKEDILKDLGDNIEIAIPIESSLITSYDKVSGRVFIKGLGKQYITVIDIKIIEPN